MALTDRCDIFGSVHEKGINRIVRHLMRQRPSLFNYGTAFFLRNPNLLCERIQAAPEVLQAHDPLLSVQDPVPILGAAIPLGLNWCLQFTDLQIDFHPGNVFHLPNELGNLPAQRLALRMRGCFGLDCPSEEFIREILPQVEAEEVAQRGKEVFGTKERQPAAPEREPIVLPTRKLQCLCVELFAVLHFEWGTIPGNPQQWLKLRLDGLEIVDLGPAPLEEMAECYIRAVLKLGILPRLSVPIEAMVLNITELMRKQGLAIGETITLQPTPVPAGVPNNPAVEDDRLKAFINLVVEV
ncbi:MAG: hypothetical protein HPY54_15865 [Chthonomonadetes bacterium]|nr:hypothetical protein [Chthonomonadetes bacterium]